MPETLWRWRCDQRVIVIAIGTKKGQKENEDDNNGVQVGLKNEGLER